MKNHLISVMESVELLLEEGFVPKRGVYICLGYNEEIVAGKETPRPVCFGGADE